MEEPNRNSVDQSNWKIIQADGFFRFWVPDEWVWKMDESPLLLVDGPHVAGSGIFVDYSEVGSRPDEKDVELYLIERTKNLVEGGISEATHDGVKSARSAFWRATDGARVRTFVKLENGHEWVVELVLTNDRKRVYILHWNGPPKDLMKFILPIFDTFELILDESEPGEAADERTSV